MCMSVRAIAENERSLSIHSTQQQPTTATTKRVLQNEKKNRNNGMCSTNMKFEKSRNRIMSYNRNRVCKIRL